jgi:hypothetical protein
MARVFLDSTRGEVWKHPLFRSFQPPPDVAEMSRDKAGAGATSEVRLRRTAGWGGKTNAVTGHLCNIRVDTGQAGRRQI